MSTIWRGLCLSHDPVIEFDLFLGTYECKSAEEAVTARDAAHAHPNCDVVFGDFSYPLVRVAIQTTSRLKEWDVTELRLVLAAHRAGVVSEVSEWLRCNSCWTIDKLTKVLGTEDAQPPEPDIRELLRTWLAEHPNQVVSVDETVHRNIGRSISEFKIAIVTKDEGK